ncbi:hypothetical protein MMC07_002546 [Pseudocyphellaria aurata]|nr:hypothetical protein [Pseudocyphellaria aurata]
MKKSKKWFESSKITIEEEVATDDERKRAKRLLYIWWDCLAAPLADMKPTDLVQHLKPSACPVDNDSEQPLAQRRRRPLPKVTSGDAKRKGGNAVQAAAGASSVAKKRTRASKEVTSVTDTPTGKRKRTSKEVTTVDSGPPPKKARLLSIPRRVRTPTVSESPSYEEYADASGRALLQRQDAADEAVRALMKSTPSAISQSVNAISKIADAAHTNVTMKEIAIHFEMRKDI